MRDRRVESVCGETFEKQVKIMREREKEGLNMSETERERERTRE